MNRLKAVIAAIGFLLLCASASGQRIKNDDVRFTSGIFIDPNATIKDGFNSGGWVEYQMDIYYNKAQFFYFPNLRGNTYFELAGVPLGLNYHFGDWKEFRGYGGLKIGAIKRVGAPFTGMMGGEYGIDFYPQGLKKHAVYLGLMGSYDYRGDGGIWEDHARPYWRGSGFIKAGITF